MSALTNEQLAQQSATVEIYTFTYLAGAYRYTSHTQNLIDANGNLYIAIPIKRTEFIIEQGAPQNNITISMVFKGTIFETIRAIHNMPISVKIEKALLSNIADKYMLYNGYIQDLQYSRQEAILKCIGGGYELDRDVPTVFLQSTCNNIIFDVLCNVDKKKYETQIRVLSITTDWSNGMGYGGVLSVANYIADSFGKHFSQQAVGYFDGGTIRYSNEYMQVAKQYPDSLHLLFPPSDSLVVGSVISIWPSCDRTPELCLSRYNNIAQFVGMPYMPSLNPAIWGVKEIT